jgi:hypothetical protein
MCERRLFLSLLQLKKTIMQSKSITILVALIIFAFQGIAQVATESASRFPNSWQKPNKGQYLNDSSWYSLGNTFGQAWFKQKIYRVQERNNAGNVLKASDFVYDTIALSWYEQTRYQGQFTNDSLRKLWLSYIFDKGTQSWLLADSISFNSNGQPVKSWFKIWDDVQGAFVGGKLSEFFYDDQQRVHLIYNRQYDTVSQQWVRYNYELYRYNQIHLDSIQEFFSWNNSANEWIDSLRISYSYDDKQNLKTQLHELWLGSNWTNSQKWNYEYSNGLLQKENKYQWLAGAWENKDYREYQYTTASLLQRRTDYLWDGSEWLNKTRKTYTYNNQQQPTLILNEFWSFGYEQWTNLSQNIYDYDNNNNRELFTFRYWDEDNNRWINSYQEQNFWTFFEPYGLPDPSPFTFSVYPNPTKGLIKINMDEANDPHAKKLLNIYNSGGVLIQTATFNGRSFSANLDGLPGGSYHFIIITPQGLMHQKVLKN